MIRSYYYNRQTKKYILGFANVFAGLQVQTGKDVLGNITTIEVPIRYGSSDRVTAAIAAGNTQNKIHTLPIMSCYLRELTLAPDRLHGVNMVDRRSYLEQGGVFPDDIKSIHRVMAIPYNMQMELSIYTSNTDQMFQILEQILMLFDYDMQLQFNDAPFDWTKISKLTLTGLNNEENYPAGADQRMIIWTLNFEMPIWISPPVEIRNKLIAQIKLRIGDMNGLNLNELDESGELIPFDDDSTYTEFDITKPVTITDPRPTNPVPGGQPGVANLSAEDLLNKQYDASLDSNCGKPQNPVNTNLI